MSINPSAKPERSVPPSVTLARSATGTSTNTAGPWVTRGSARAPGSAITLPVTSAASSRSCRRGSAPRSMPRSGAGGGGADDRDREVVWTDGGGGDRAARAELGEVERRAIHRSGASHERVAVVALDPRHPGDRDQVGRAADHLGREQPEAGAERDVVVPPEVLRGGEVRRRRANAIHRARRPAFYRLGAAGREVGEVLLLESLALLAQHEEPGERERDARHDEHDETHIEDAGLAADRCRLPDLSACVHPGCQGPRGDRLRSPSPRPVDGRSDRRPLPESAPCRHA